MYSMLDLVNSEDAVHIIYYAIKILNKGKNGPSHIIDIDNIETDLNPEQERIADKLLDEVDYLNIKDDNEVDRIISELFEILNAKTNGERKIDIERGKRLLDMIKEEKS